MSGSQTEETRRSTTTTVTTPAPIADLGFWRSWHPGRLGTNNNLVIIPHCLAHPSGSDFQAGAGLHNHAQCPRVPTTSLSSSTTLPDLLPQVLAYPNSTTACHWPLATIANSAFLRFITRNPGPPVVHRPYLNLKFNLLTLAMF